jgi:DNA-binding CsgD family transcriptional regulator
MVARLARYDLEAYETILWMAESRRLSPSQLELLRLLAQGLTNCEIAARLATSPKSVGTRIYELKMRLHARTRTHIVAIAYERGLLPVAAYEEIAVPERGPRR